MRTSGVGATRVVPWERCGNGGTGVRAGALTPVPGGVVRRRPTLPPRLRGSTIGAERLSFRVRNGTGRFPLAMAAVTQVNTDQTPVGGLVRSEPHSGRVIDLRLPTARPGPVWGGGGVVVWSSPRPVSTGQLAHLAVLPLPAYQPAGLGGGLTRLSR